MIVYENNIDITFTLEFEDMTNAHNFIHELKSNAPVSQSGMNYIIPIEHKQSFDKLRVKHFGFEKDNY
jgi:hypothetical protein